MVAAARTGGKAATAPLVVWVAWVRWRPRGSWQPLAVGPTREVARQWLLRNIFRSHKVPRAWCVSPRGRRPGRLQELLILLRSGRAPAG
jgi:hypothetical protein